LLPLLEKSATRESEPARVVITGSFMAFDIAAGIARLDDQQLAARPGSVNFGVGPLSIAQAMSYAHSKLLLHMYAKHIGAQVLDPKKIRIVVVDPGIVNTDMHAAIKLCLGPWMGAAVYTVADWIGCLRSPQEGAAPLVHCCTRRNLPMCQTASALYCDWGKTYLRARELATDMDRFHSSDLFHNGHFQLGIAKAPSLGDEAQCARVFDDTESIRARLRTCPPSTAAVNCRAEISHNVKEVPILTVYGACFWAHFFYIDFMAPLSDFLTQCPPGPPLLPFRYVVNFQKGGTLPFCIFLMSYHGNFSPTAWIYTAIHGSYGLCWLLKDTYFPDANTKEKGSFVGISLLIMILSFYWYMPWVVIATRVEVHVAQQAVCVCMCMTGVVLMMVADCQKYFALGYNRELAHRKLYLIENGVFSTNRNPNYLGEMLLYGSFALMTGPRLEVLLILGAIWLIIFGTNMMKKDLSLQGKPGWSAYRERSHLFFFKWWTTPPSTFSNPQRGKKTI